MARKAFLLCSQRSFAELAALFCPFHDLDEGAGIEEAKIVTARSLAVLQQGPQPSLALTAAVSKGPPWDNSGTGSQLKYYNPKMHLLSSGVLLS